MPPKPRTAFTLCPSERSLLTHSKPVAPPAPTTAVVILLLLLGRSWEESGMVGLAEARTSVNRAIKAARNVMLPDSDDAEVISTRD